MTAWKKCLNRYDINLVKAYDINSVRNTPLNPAYQDTAYGRFFQIASNLFALSASMRTSGEEPDPSDL